MNCALLEDDRYVDNIKSEGYKNLSGNRNIWDWLKYNIRALMQFSTQNRGQKKRVEKENHLQEKYS